MSEDFPTFAEVGEQNIRERCRRLGKIMPLSVPVIDLSNLEDDVKKVRSYHLNEFERK